MAEDLPGTQKMLVGSGEASSWAPAWFILVLHCSEVTSLAIGFTIRVWRVTVTTDSSLWYLEVYEPPLVNDNSM